MRPQSNKELFNYSLKLNQNKPIILFLPGFMGNLHAFEKIIALLESRFSYLAIDLCDRPPTQIEDKERLYNMENTAKALIKLLDSLKIKKCFLLGYSMGGRLALYLTIYFPHYFEKVILESASAGLKTREARNERLKKDLALAQKLESSDLASFLADWYRNPLFDSLKKYPDFSELIEERLKNDPFKLANSLRSLSVGSQPSLWEELKYNKIPTLLVVGELDFKFIKINTEMRELCSSFQLVIVKGCGHNIHWENPQQFVNLIKKFLLES